MLGALGRVVLWVRGVFGNDILFPKHWYAGGGVKSCGGSVCSLFSVIVSTGSSLNGSCLYFLSGNGGFCFFVGEFVVLNCNLLSVLRIVVL